MKYSLHVLLTFLLVIITASAQATQKTAPKEIGGFKLGSSIDDYEFISYTNFLKQVVVENVGAFRKGIIEYGVCKHPGEIVKIKLKYKDNSEPFFRMLLKQYKKKLGKPDKFTGDPFGILKSWKWHFTDENGEAISLSLQYNKKNFEESMGSVVKMSMPLRIEQERKCFNEVCALQEGEIATPPVLQESHLDLIIPR